MMIRRGETILKNAEELEIIKVLEKGSNFMIASVDDFNLGINHILCLIKDARLLLLNGSFASSAFMSIAVIEETSKLCAGLFLGLNNDRLSEKIKRDPLFNHSTKHKMSYTPTLLMGERLTKSVSSESLQNILNLSQYGGLKKVRENSIYINMEGAKLIIPSEHIDKQFAKDILLYSIESFDDMLVGFTNHSINVSLETDIIFEEISLLVS